MAEFQAANNMAEDNSWLINDMHKGRESECMRLKAANGPCLLGFTSWWAELSFWVIS